VSDGKSKPWRSRIIGHGEEAPDQLLANPKNWRIHPKPQQDALSGMLDDVGWVQSVIVNKQTGFVVDGHLRVAMAISHGDKTIPVTYVDLTEAEEAEVLATIDPLSAMAVADKEQLDSLLREAQSGDSAVQAMLAELAEKSGIMGADWGAALDDLPEGDRAAFQQMTFTVSDAQAEAVKGALAKAKHDGDFVDTGNENSNGNALARICEAYVERG
jgi:hypothetical protein